VLSFFAAVKEIVALKILKVKHYKKKISQSRI
jgi:hypothetical protein